MADPTFAPMSEDADDLPRTFRREKEAREREARERAARERAAAPSLTVTPDPYAAQSAAPKIYAETGPTVAPSVPMTAADGMAVPAVVRAFDVPFGHLVAFFLKAVVAAVPALLLLMVMLWGFGQVLERFFPGLLKMKILIGVG